jgi:hypothetical protein
MHVKTNPILSAVIALALGAGSARAAWEKIPKPTYLSQFDEIAVGKNGHLYSRSNGSVWHSADGGKTFEQLAMAITIKGSLVPGGGIVGGSPIVVAASGNLFMGIGALAGGNIAYAVIRSKDHGKTWTSVDSTGNVANVYACPNGDLYLAAPVGSLPALKALWRSSDDGDSWEKAADFDIINLVAIDPDNRLFVDGVLPGSSKSSLKLYRSVNYGVKWDSLALSGGYGANSLIANRPGCLLMGSGFNINVSTPAAPSLTAHELTVSNTVTTAIIFTPDLHILQGRDYQGVWDLAPPYDSHTTMSQGLGGDTTHFSMMQYDEKDNLYVIASASLYVLKGSGAPVRPVGKDYRLLHPLRESDRYDPAGRRVNAAGEAPLWRVLFRD